MALKKAQIEEFKSRLIELRAQLNIALKEATEGVKVSDESKGYSQHQADEGTDDFGRTINLEISSKESFILRQVERALEKIEEGTYGTCDITEEEIPIKRLDAVPYATMTVTAQDKFEKGLL
ncbi:RNA polymerase-binding transcription factor [Candidatus Aerophobetes bacterium]|uniref:RNA polymerase-binding transcription factor n=1 Tax=Aerophobetes bacterium TaxID=2030807 RepID=A0A2A4YHR7_UNCAE|nr:MAG: RNA polymerase-binding transcription factor [Candidatus Aerophobetes bacterium]